MTECNTLLRRVHDLGLGAWFGGVSAGAVGINGAAADMPHADARLRVADAGWGRWSSLQLTAIAVHLIGAAGLGYANRARVVAQRGVRASTVAKTGFTAAALAATAYRARLGRKVGRGTGTPVEGSTGPALETPPEVARARRQLEVCRWLVPARTGGSAVLNAVYGEQQRPRQQVRGILAKPAELLRPAS